MDKKSNCFRKKTVLCILILLLALASSACDGLDAGNLLRGTPVSVQGVQITAVVLARRLDSDLQPTEATQSFSPEEAIFLSVKLDGQPVSGTLEARFFYGNQYLGGSSIDLADTSSELLRRVGQHSFAAFILRYPDALLISPHYTVELFINDQLAGDYAFAIHPPADAIATIVNAVLLAREQDGAIQPIGLEDRFSAEDTVYLIGEGDFGRLSWLQAEWYIADQLVQECTTYISMESNYSDERFLFKCAVDGGWTGGTHRIVLVADDEVVTQETFEVD